MGVASAAELSQSKIGDFEISILSEVPNIDLSGIEIDVYSAQVAFADNATGYVEYDEEFAFTVKTGEDGIVNFVKPSQAFSITIRLETLPQNLGIDNHTKFFTAEAKSYQAVLSEIAEVNISHSSGEFVPCMYDKNGNAVYADAKTEVINNGRKTLYSVDASKVPLGEIQTHVILGLNPGLINASGYFWNADYVTVTGDLCADLLSNIASEQRAKVVYEYLYRQIEDKKVREIIDFLLNREEAHNQMFRDAFNKVQSTGSNWGFGTTQAAKMYLSMSDPGPNAFANGETKPVFFNDSLQVC